MAGATAVAAFAAQVQRAAPWRAAVSTANAALARPAGADDAARALRRDLKDAKHRARRETGDADVDATDERTLAKYKYLAVYGEDARDRADVEAPAASA